jgi:hypothetical protein
MPVHLHRITAKISQSALIAKQCDVQRFFGDAGAARFGCKREHSQTAQLLLRALKTKTPPRANPQRRFRNLVLEVKKFTSSSSRPPSSRASRFSSQQLFSSQP